MPDNGQNRPVFTQNDISDAVCIHTNQIEDACIDKDCVEDLRVYLTQDSQGLLDQATSAKARSAELVYVYIDVTAMAYHREQYALDLTFYYKVMGDALINGLRPCTIYGLASFSKRVVLNGGPSGAKIFSNRSICLGENCGMPEAIVEAVDPLVLSSAVMETAGDPRSDPLPAELPETVSSHFDGSLVTSGECRRLYVTLGQFSTVRLERSAQLTIPIFEYTVPDKECCDSQDCVETPCDTFSRIDFPVQTFFPNGSSEPGTDAAQKYGTLN